MEFSALSDIYKELESTSKRLEITDMISKFIITVPDAELKYIVLFLMGKIFPDYDDREAGISSKLVEKAVVKAAGVSDKELQTKLNEVGDIGLVTEFFMSKKRQMTLGKRTIDTNKFLETMDKAASMVGKGTTLNKIDLIAGLLANASSDDAKYIAKLIIGELRVGAGEGSIRDAIAKAFDIDKKIVERAWHLMPNYGEIAYIAKKKGEKGLTDMKIVLGIPIVVQLAEKAKTLKEITTKLEKPAIEWKYDGLRSQIHKQGDKIWIFTRSLENVTKQFPELVKHFKKAIKAKDAVIDSETLAIDKEGKPLPFQKLSQRIQRKYDIQEMVDKINVKTEVFDIVYLDGELLFDKPLHERWEILKKILKEEKGKVSLAKQLRTKDIKKAEKFYKDSLENGQEGVMVKNLNAKYQPGRRVGYWFKIKPVMESLDLVVTGATYGTGKRAGTLSSFILSCKKDEKFVPVGMMASGLKEKKNEQDDLTYAEMTEMIKPLIISETKNEVNIKPKIVVEVEYQEIQMSNKYESGFALRFPRFIRLRQDKDSRDVDDIVRVRRLFGLQGGIKNKRASKR